MTIKLLLDKYRGEASFAIANVLTSCVTLLTGIIAAIFVVPEELGVIQTVLLISTYASFMHLGVFSGLNRNLAYYKAKGDLVTMQDEVNTSYSVSLIVSAISGLIGVCVFVYYLYMGYGRIYLLSCILLFATLVISPLITVIEATYKSGQEFGRLGKIKNIQSIVYLVISFLPVVIGALGRIIASSINLIIGLLLRSVNPPYKRTGKGSLSSFKDLLYTGFPILMSSYLGSILSVMDKTYIASSLTPRDVGLYSIAGYCITLFMMIPTSISALLYPKAAAIYGSTGKKEALLGFWKKSILIMAVVLFPVIIIVYFLMPNIVGIVMPKYIDGVSAARITLLTCATFIYFGPSSIFGTLRKNNVYIVVQVVILLVFWLVISFFGTHFYSLERVAWLRFSLSIIQMTFVIVYSRLLLKTNI